MTNFEKVKITIFATIIAATVFWFYPRAQAPEPPPEMVIVCITGAPLPTEPEFKAYDVPLSVELQEYAQKQGEKSSVPLNLVLAVIWQESGFRPNVVSHTGDYGLMQVNECNHKALRQELGVTDIMDERQNILAGIHILSQAVEQTDSLNDALMVYNLGPAGAKRQWAKGVTSTPYSRGVLEKMMGLEVKT